MRIGIDARAIGAYPGIGTYGSQLIKALSTIDRENEYLIFKHSQAPLPLEANANFTIVPVDIPLLSMGSLFRFGTIAARHRLDIFHSLGEVLPLTGGFKKIITVHDVMNIVYPWAFNHQGLVRDYALRLFFRTFGRYGIRKASAIITVSQYTRQDLIKLLAIADDRISVTYEAASDHFRPATPEDSARVKAEQALPDRFLFYIGSIKPNKNMVRLIQGYRPHPLSLSTPQQTALHTASSHRRTVHIVTPGIKQY